MELFVRQVFYNSKHFSPLGQKGIHQKVKCTSEIMKSICCKTIPWYREPTHQHNHFPQMQQPLAFSRHIHHLHWGENPKSNEQLKVKQDTKCKFTLWIHIFRMSNYYIGACRYSYRVCDRGKNLNAVHASFDWSNLCCCSAKLFRRISRVNLTNKQGRAYGMKNKVIHYANRRMWQRHLCSYHCKIQSMTNYRGLCRWTEFLAHGCYAPHKFQSSW
jgi:hypothetical protein